MVKCGFKKQTPTKYHMFERDCTTCSKYANHSRLDIQYDWKDLYNHFMNTKIFKLIMIRHSYQSFKHCEAIGDRYNLDLLIISL